MADCGHDKLEMSGMGGKHLSNRKTPFRMLPIPKLQENNSVVKESQKNVLGTKALKTLCGSLLHLTSRKETSASVFVVHCSGNRKCCFVLFCFTKETRPCFKTPMI